MSAYWIGDQPPEPLTIAPARDGKLIDLAGYSSATAVLTTPAGQDVSAAAQLIDDEDEGRVVAVELPQLTDAGLWQLRVVVATDTGSATFEAPPIVVQAFDGWHSIGSAHGAWPDSAALEDDRLHVLLETAKRECLAYAPLPAGLVPPVSYREAQLLHARNRNAAGRIDPSNGDAGGDGFALSAFPLDWTIRQLLRPQRGYKRVR